MTIATTRSHEFDVDKICKLAWRKAGLLSIYQSMNAQQAAAARELLELIVHSTETEGMFARSVIFESVTLADGTYVYPLSASTIDVTGTAMYVLPNQTAVELPVQIISRERWQTIGVRTASGPPTLAYIHRQAVPYEAWLWPTPGASEAAGTVRFQSHRLRADVTAAGVTPDFEVYWADFLTTRLAKEIAQASGRGIDVVNDLERQSEIQLRKCRGKSNQSTMQQLVLCHGRR